MVEMLIALVVTMVVTGGALALALSSRQLFALDAARTRLNESIRGSRDFLMSDIRQVGERLGPAFPAIEIVNGDDLPGGQIGDPDRLVLRRNLLDTTLRSCQSVEDGDRRIYISGLGEDEDSGDDPRPGCVPVPDSDGDGWADNHQVWRDYREAHGVEIDGRITVPAYLYNPQTGEGEFFPYNRDDNGDAYIETTADHDWVHDYPAADQCQVFLLEERRYQLDGDLLQMIVNQDEAHPLNLVDGIEDFQLRARFKIPSPPAAPVEPAPQDSFGPGDNWTMLRAIEVRVNGKVAVKDEFIEREWSSEILPRNVLSR
jgi:type IV pilus assembly protein PilW